MSEEQTDAQIEKKKEKVNTFKCNEFMKTNKTFHISVFWSMNYFPNTRTRICQQVLISPPQ